MPQDVIDQLQRTDNLLQSQCMPFLYVYIYVRGADIPAAIEKLHLIYATRGPLFVTDQNGRSTLHPQDFQYHKKSVPFNSVHDVLGYVMSNAVGSVLSEEPASEEDLQAWLALYCKFISVLQEKPVDAP